MKNQKGISLVALIITIIVMVILAGIIIVSAVADGGVIDRAQAAIRENERADVQEIIIGSYVFKVTASTNPIAYLDLEKTGLAIHENLKANGFELTNKTTNSEGEYTAPVTQENGKNVINVIVTGDHGEYTGTVTEKGLEEDLKISEDNNDDDNDDDNDVENEEGRIDYRLINYEENEDNTLTITSIYANQYQACFDAIINWEFEEEEPKMPKQATKEEIAILKTLLSTKKYSSEENLVNILPITFSFEDGSYDTKYKEKYGDYTSYAESILMYVIGSSNELPSQIDNQDFIDAINMERKNYNSYLEADSEYRTLKSSIVKESLIDYVIPDTIDGKKVSKIGKINFKYINFEGTLTVSEGIESIGNSAFTGGEDDKIFKIIIPSTIKNIEESSFISCKGLSEIIIPDNTITVIENSSFEGCINLVKINIPNGVTTIKSSAFSNCSKLKELQVANSVIEIESWAFNRCISLEKVELPESIENMTSTSFENCSGIKEITIPCSLGTENSYSHWYLDNIEKVTFLGKVEIIPASFQGNTSLKEVIMEEGVKVIANAAFLGCTNLTSMTIPKSMERIELGFISECGILKDIYYGGTKDEWEVLNEQYGELNYVEGITIHCTDETFET